MDITKKAVGSQLTIAPNGRVDTITAPKLENELILSLTDDVKELVLDFAGVTYISSAGLRVILYAQKQMHKQGEMKLINVSDNVMEVLELTGFTDILTIE